MRRKRNRSGNHADLHGFALSSAWREAQEGWFLEWYHQMIEKEPELREWLRESAAEFARRMYEALRKNRTRDRK